MTACFGRLVWVIAWRPQRSRPWVPPPRAGLPARGDLPAREVLLRQPVRPPREDLLGLLPRAVRPAREDRSFV